MTNQGTCLCGSVRYEIDGSFESMLHCHCSICRKHHGAAFATYVTAPIARLRWQTADARLGRYASSDGGERRFCETCGSVAPSLVPELGLAYCPAANLLGELELRPQYHMFVGSKAPWYEITDDLPQYDAFPPEQSNAEPVHTPRLTTANATTGSCLCGAVMFEIDGPPKRMLHCHCSRCRRSRSAAHASNLVYDAANFRFTAGVENVREYKLPEAERFTVGFCKICGGATPRVPRSDVAYVAAGILDGDPGRCPSEHIFVGSKASWYEITDELPQYERGSA